MKRFLLLFSFLFLYANSFSQVITVNTTTYTVPQLVQNVLFGSTASAACAGTLSNITWSTGTNFSSTNGIGYFTNTNPNFPLSNGVILSSGNVVAAPGPNSSIQSNGNWQGDTQLFDYITSLGIDPFLTDYNNATILEFDFVPLSNTMSFDFLFASEEYGTFQCDYSDAFAFFLTNNSVFGAPTVNLALVPGTSDPISVLTVRDGANNSTCTPPDVNETYFGSYTPSSTTNPASLAAPTNFNGLTVKMTAQSTVVPNDTYHIKLVIADRNDDSYDSAVFLAGGSFNIGSEIVSGSGFSNPSYSIVDGTAICYGGTRDIVFGATAIAGATYTWFNGTTQVSSGPSNIFSVSQPGNYSVTVLLPSGCQYDSTNNFLVEFYPQLPLIQPLDLTEATGIFNLDSNTSLMLNGANPSDYEISYHLTLADAQNIANPITNTSAFPGTNGQIIYVAIQDLIGAGCTETRSFTLNTSCSTITVPSSNQTLCVDSDPAAFSVATTFTGSDTISFVYFNTAQTGSNMYTGGTLLGNSTPASAIATYDAPALGTAGSLPNVAGNYYVYAIANPIPTDVTCRPFQVIQVTINPQPTAGTDGNTTICETDATLITLSSLITGEQTGGTWTQTTGSGGVFNATSGTFTPAVGATTSTFTYTLTGIAPCINDSSVATININPQPLAGADGNTTICETDATLITLSSLITGEQTGGTWTQTSGSGGLFNAAAGTFTPAVGATTSTFTYTLTGVAPCINDSSVATVTINPQPTAGADGNSTVCETDATLITLSSLITSEQTGGTWTQTTGSGGLFNAAAGTFTPAVGATTSTFTYTLTGIAPCINDSSVATVTINPQPTAGANGGTTICESNTTPIILSNLITGEQTGGVWVRSSGTGGVFTAATGTFTPAAGAVTSTFTYTLTGVAPCVNSSSTATVTIIAAPIIATPTSYQVCDENTDGISCLFFLHTKDAEITSDPNVVVTYHLTPTDASTGANPIIQNPYCNITPNTQLLHVRVVNPADPTCASTTTLQLIVNPKPLINAAVTPYQLCDNNNPGDGVEEFNLPTQTTQIINGQPNMVVSYYLTQADANNQVIPSLPNLYTSATQTIWYTIKNTLTGCISVGPLNLVVNPLPTVTVNSPTVCTGDLATLTATPNTSGTYSYAWTVPTGVPAPGNVPSFTTLIAGNYSVIITNTVTGCVSASASATVTLISAPIITQPTNYVVCDDNNDGVSCLFDLQTKNAQISTQPGIQITYHLTPTDAQTGSNAILAGAYCNISNPQTIHVRIFDPLAPACSSFTSFQLIVNPKPVAGVVSDYHLCDSNPSLTITQAVFNLTAVVTPQVLATNLPAANYTVTYYTSLANAQVPTNAISSGAALAYTSGSTTLWIRIQNNTTGCFDITTVTLVVDSLPTVLSFYPQYELCETVAPLGIETFNLTSQVPSILLTQSGMDVTFYPSLGQAQSGLGAIATPSAYTNVIAYAQTLGIRVTNLATGCYSISTMDLVVNPLPMPIAPITAYVVCDTDQNGTAQFDLNTITPGITFQTPGVYTISYYLTPEDAATPENPIDLTVPFTNNNLVVQYLWVRAQSPTTGCFSVIRIELNVEPAPIMPTTLAPIANCDVDSNTQDGCTYFNLETQTPIILAAQALPASNYTVSYYTTLAAASSTIAGPSIIQTTNYYACGTPTIWVRIENNATDCFAVGSFQLQVNTPIVLTTPTLLSICDNDAVPNNLYTIFNMSGFLGTIPGHTLEFFLDANHTQLISNPAAFENTIAATQTVFVVATNTTTGCKSYRTLTLQVLPVPTPNTDLSLLGLEKCDDTNPAANDGYEVFDLTTNATYIINGDPNVTLHYYPSYTDAIAGTNEITTGSPIGVPTAANVNQNVWIRVESNFFIGTDGEHCYVLVEQPIKVNPLPLITANKVFQQCDDDTDGFTVFNLGSYANELLSNNPLPLSDYTLAFYLDAAQTIPIGTPNAYTNTNTTGNTQIIYVVATDVDTNCKSMVGQFTIMVNPKPTLTVPPPFSTCDDELNDNDGYYPYDLSLLIPNILGATQTLTDYEVNFYNSQYNPEATPALLPVAIADLVNYQAYTHTVWIAVKNKVTGCERIGFFSIIVEQKPTPVIVAPTGVICVDYNTQQVVRDLTLTATNTTSYLPGTPTVNYTYQWFDAGVAIPGATASTYVVATTLPNNDFTNYTVSMTSASALACNNVSPNFLVSQSGQAVIPAGTIGYTITNAFSSNQTITIDVDGYGIYQYSLDEGPRQTSTVFENVSLGSHTITVWDTEGGLALSCDPLVITGVQTIDYPHYFTPNGDGIHDTWNIVGLSGQVNAKIYIFDRQGKLIKQISPAGLGWDGTYNGNLLLSTDYWFTVDYNEAAAIKQFKAHFSLKR